MFDFLKMGEMMKQAKQLQERMQAMQEEMARRQISADAAGGSVVATVNGRMELINIAIDKSKINPADTEMLEQLIVSAVTAAQAKAAVALKEEMTKVTAGLPIPPGMLPGM